MRTLPIHMVIHTVAASFKRKQTLAESITCKKASFPWLSINSLNLHPLIKVTRAHRIAWDIYATRSTIGRMV